MKFPKSKVAVRKISSPFNYSKKPSSRPSSVASDPYASTMSDCDEPQSTAAVLPTLTAHEELGVVTELTKCCVCSRIFKDPVTLSCGNTVCYSCLPPFDLHTVWKFECPIVDCKRKSHLFGDIKIDVALHKLTDIIQREIEKNRPPSPPQRRPVVVDWDSESVVGKEDECRASSLSPSMAFLESDLWSDLESTVSSPPFVSESSDAEAAPSVAESSTSSPPTSCSTTDTQDISFKDRMLSELECQICYLLYYEPITTPCGHTFCKSCILRSIDHTDKCPLCRHKLPGYTFFQTHSVNVALNRVITNIFAQLWHDRRVATEAELYDLLEDIPIFVCSLAFPKMPLFLHIFEPRYRLMLRRCMESRQRFGMVLPGRNSEPYKEYGTMLEITNVTMLPDGRAMVETVGSFRFRVVERGMRDGYNTAKIERVEDISPEEEDELEQADLALDSSLASNTSQRTEEDGVEGRENGVSEENGASEEREQEQEQRQQQSENIPGSYDSESRESSEDRSRVAEPRPSQPTAQLISQARLFVEQLKTTSAPWLLQRLNSTYGDIPDNGSDFSWWIASVFPFDEHERYSLLEVTSVRQRMRIVTAWIAKLRGQWWFASGACTVT